MPVSVLVVMMICRAGSAASNARPAGGRTAIRRNARAVEHQAACAGGFGASRGNMAQACRPVGSVFAGAGTLDQQKRQCKQQGDGVEDVQNNGQSVPIQRKLATNATK